MTFRFPFRSAMVIASAVVSTGVCQAQPAPIGYWNFNETSGTTANASVGSINGTLNGGVAFAPGAGIQGGAIQFDVSTTGLVNMGDNFAFPAGSYAIQAWVKTNPGDTVAMAPVSKHTSTIMSGYFLAINDASGIGSSAVNKAYFYASNGVSGVSTLNVNDGNWHQLVGVYDATNNFTQSFVDGTLQNTGPRVPMSTTAASFLVGGINSSTNVPLGAYRGLIDEVKVWNTALTPADVQSLYSSVVPEPSAMILVGVGSVVGAVRLRKNKRSSSL